MLDPLPNIHRPVKTFQIQITDSGEPETVIFRGQNAAHAEERFTDRMMDTGGMEGIRVLSVTRYHSPAEKIRRRYNRNSPTP